MRLKYLHQVESYLQEIEMLLLHLEQGEVTDSNVENIQWNSFLFDQITCERSILVLVRKSICKIVFMLRIYSRLLVNYRIKVSR